LLSQSKTPPAAGTTRTPAKGAPDTTTTFPDDKGGSTDRKYGPDGKAVTDVDKGHDHNDAGDPHVHDWDWTGKKPKRGDARTPKEGEIPAPAPTPAPEAQPSASSRAWNAIKSIPPKRVVEAGVGWVIVYVIVSEGTRVIPARNLVPIP